MSVRWHGQTPRIRLWRRTSRRDLEIKLDTLLDMQRVQSRVLRQLSLMAAKQRDPRLWRVPPLEDCQEVADDNDL